MLKNNFPDQYIKIDQINTRFWVAGLRGADVVILIHGLGGFLDYWDKNVTALSKQHLVYALDLVGFGRSDKPEAPYSVKYLAEFVRKFMDTLGLAKVTLVGNSMGGGVVLQFALMFPERVNKLVLEDSAGFGYEASFLLRILSLPIIGNLLVHPSKLGIRIFLREVMYDSRLVTDDFVNLSYRMIALPGARRTYLAMLRSMGNFSGAKSEFIKPIRENIGKINNSTLIIWGKQDRQLPIKHAFIAKNGIPHAKMEIIDDCGHIPHFEQSEQFNKIVLGFLAS